MLKHLILVYAATTWLLIPSCRDYVMLCGLLTNLTLSQNQAIASDDQNPYSWLSIQLEEGKNPPYIIVKKTSLKTTTVKIRKNNIPLLIRDDIVLACSDSITIPANVELAVEGQGLLSGDLSGLVIEGIIRASDHQIFDCSAGQEPRIASGPVMASWFGENGLSSAIQSVVADDGVVTVGDVQEVSDDLEIPSNVELFMTKSGVLKPASGKTVTINGPLTASWTQIFDLSEGGTVVLAPNAVREVYPDWWGIFMDGVHSDAPAIQAAVDAHPRCVVMAGDYYVDVPIVIDRDRSVVGAAREKTRIIAMSGFDGSSGPYPGVDAVIKLYGTVEDSVSWFITLEDLLIFGAAIPGTDAPNADYGIYSETGYSAAFLTTDRIRVAGFNEDGVHLTGFMVNLNMMWVVNCKRGFAIGSASGGTSYAMTNCYAAAVETGFYIDNLVYFNMRACAVDQANDTGYNFYGNCVGTLQDSGCEQVKRPLTITGASSMMNVQGCRFYDIGDWNGELGDPSYFFGFVGYVRFTGNLIQAITNPETVPFIYTTSESYWLEFHGNRIWDLGAQWGAWPWHDYPCTISSSLQLVLSDYHPVVRQIRLMVDTTWSSGSTYVAGDRVLRSANGYVYECVTAGAGTSTDAPSHTSGSVVEADGYEWLVISSTWTLTTGVAEYLWIQWTDLDSQNLAQFWNTSTRRLQIQVRGTYRVSARIKVDGVAAGGTVRLRLYAHPNATGTNDIIAEKTVTNDHATDARNVSVELSRFISLAYHDGLSAQVLLTDAANRSVDLGETWLEIERVE